MIDFLYHWCQLFGSIPMERKEAKTQQIHRKKSVSTIGMIHFCASMFMPNAEKDTSFKNWQLPKKVSFLAEISRSLSVSLNSRLSRFKKVVCRNAKWRTGLILCATIAKGFQAQTVRLLGRHGDAHLSLWIGMNMDAISCHVVKLHLLMYWIMNVRDSVKQLDFFTVVKERFFVERKCCMIVVWCPVWRSGHMPQDPPIHLQWVLTNKIQHVFPYWSSTFIKDHPPCGKMTQIGS